ncbi:unnamed protein product [Gongylonema pulchrum]|uniref:Group-specific protein n=1 Tax=Gongylonema pulchrum TaxID=637853 RepID=A0A183EJ21_9BILA|nr:unnamed protein product [Gongylonema pulchrum]
MEVLNPKQTIITNAELLRLLQERREQQCDLPSKQRSKVLGTLIYEVYFFYHSFIPHISYYRRRGEEDHVQFQQDDVYRTFVTVGILRQEVLAEKIIILETAKVGNLKF